MSYGAVPSGLVIDLYAFPALTCRAFACGLPPLRGWAIPPCEKEAGRRTQVFLPPAPSSQPPHPNVEIEQRAVNQRKLEGTPSFPAVGKGGDFHLCLGG